MMKIDKSCYLVHDPIFDNTPTPLAYSQAIYTFSYLMADKLNMKTGWWIHEAEDIVDSYGDGRGWWTKAVFASAWERSGNA